MKKIMMAAAIVMLLPTTLLAAQVDLKKKCFKTHQKNKAALQLLTKKDVVEGVKSTGGKSRGLDRSMSTENSGS